MGAARLGLALARIVAGSRRLDPARSGAALRAYLESMGFTYVKMGQFLALRFDVLPDAVCLELRKLFDQAAPMPFHQAKSWIEHELHGPLDRFFQVVEPEAVAAASLAQVHVATALDGERLALKVQRPQARRDFEADMRLAGAIARLVDWSGLLRSVSLVDMLAEFENFTHRELDFELEGRVASRLASQTGPGVRIPSIRWDLTTPRLLAMEFVEGQSLAEAIRRAKEYGAGPGSPAEVDVAGVIRAVAHESLRQVLIDGLFHADPHPGNILIDEDGAVVYLDFGMFGFLSPEQRRYCAGYIESAAVGNPQRSFNYFFRLVHPTADLNRPQFKRDMVVLMRDWAEWRSDDGQDYRGRHLGAIMAKTLTTMRSHGARLDTDLLLFWRVLFVLDSVALDLADHLDLIEVLREFFSRHSPSPLSRLGSLKGAAVPDLAPPRRALARTATQLRSTEVDVARTKVTTRRTRGRRRGEWRQAWLLVASLTFVAAAIVVRL